MSNSHSFSSSQAARTSPERQFARYVLPSMFTMLLTGFYAIVDGFFIGRATGDVGLAAINIAWPVTAVIMATGTGIGVGGSILMSLLKGQGEKEASRKAKALTLLLLLAASLVVTALFLWCYRPLLALLGAQGKVMDAAADYTRVVVLGSILQIMGCGAAPLLRNSGRTLAAMFSMVSGLLVNILLDWLFVMVFRWSITGAAVATITAQGVVAAIVLILLFTAREKRDGGSFRALFSSEAGDGPGAWGWMIRRILIIGLSPFGLSLAPNVILIFNNLQCLRYGGDSAVAAYAVITYLASPAQLLLQGIGDGVQPLISFCRGAGERGQMKRLMQKSFLLSMSIAVLFTLAGILGRTLFPAAFGTAPETQALIETGLVIYSAGFVFTGVVRLLSAYFYACAHTGVSTLLIYADPILLSPLLLALLPLAWELNGVWAAFPAAQLLLAVMAGLFYLRDARRAAAPLPSDPELQSGQRGRSA